MFFENSLMTTSSILIANQVIKNFVYSSYETINKSNIEMINIDIAKYSLILPIIAFIYELLTIIRYYKKENYINKKLNSRIYRVEGQLLHPNQKQD